MLAELPTRIRQSKRGKKKHESSHHFVFWCVRLPILWNDFLWRIIHFNIASCMHSHFAYMCAVCIWWMLMCGACDLIKNIKAHLAIIN